MKFLLGIFGTGQPKNLASPPISEALSNNRGLRIEREGNVEFTESASDQVRPVVATLGPPNFVD